MKLQSKSFMLVFEEEVQIGELKATLAAMVMGTKEGFDIDFTDVYDISFMGASIDGYSNFNKFKQFHLEMGIDFDKLIQNKFDESFTKEAVGKYVNDIKF